MPGLLNLYRIHIYTNGPKVGNGFTEELDFRNVPTKLMISYLHILNEKKT